MSSSRRDFVKHLGAAATALAVEGKGRVDQERPIPLGPDAKAAFPSLNRRTRGWLRFLWDKATTADDWSSSGVPHQWWDVYTSPGVTSYGRFDLQTSSYALLLMADQTGDSMRRHACVLTLLLVAVLLIGARPTAAQIVITGPDDVNFKLGVLGQLQGDTIDNPDPEPNTSNLFIRRFRLLFGGQIAKNVTFFVETDAPNLGRTLPTGKNIQPSVILQDAYGEFRATDAFMLDAGLMFVPFSRNSIQSAATLLPIDYGAYTFTQSAPTQSTTGRDAGFQARGYLVANHLEYRIGVFQGERNARSDNAFRYVGRVQYNVLDTESGFFYTGTYLGKKRILAIGGAFDAQSDYHGYDADAFFDYPVGPGAVTAQFDYNHFDGGRTLTTLPKQQDYLLEAGYLIRDLKLTPVVQIMRRDVSDVSQGDETRVGAGANYWWSGHNANVKALYTRISPSGLFKQNEFTVQLQLFVF